MSVALGTLLLPWKLLASPETYVFVWLGFYGGIMGAVGGVLVSDYWLARKTELRVPELFTLEGHYHFTRGWNVRAVIATAVGAFVAVGGAYSALGPDGKKTGPFPADGVVPLLRPLYDYNWVVAFLVAMFVYWLLAAHRRKRHSTVPFDAAPEPATVRS